MMTDCATLNDLINVIATLCPTLLCISTSLYTGAHLSALKHTRAVINLIEDKRTLLKKIAYPDFYVSSAKMGEKRQCLAYMYTPRCKM